MNAIHVLRKGYEWGPLLFGIGVGGEFPPEFDACGVPVGERGGRTDEGIDIVRKLWTQDAVEHAGRFFEFGPVTLAPKPAQAGGPPIIVGGRKRPSIRRAGQRGDGYVNYVAGANIAGFLKVADAMMAYGVV